MNLMSWAPALVFLASGAALGQQPQPHRDMHDYRMPVVRGSGGVPGVYLGSTGTDWAQQIDFASATERVDVGGLPRPTLPPTGEEPFGPVPRGGDAGTALAVNIRSEDTLGNLAEALPVPEPSALLMMLAGIGVIAFVIRRRINDS